MQSYYILKTIVVLQAMKVLLREESGCSFSVSVFLHISA